VVPQEFLVLCFAAEDFLLRKGEKIMVIHFEKLSRALDAFNAARVESERMDWHELIQDIDDPLNEKEVMSLIIELYEDAF
jgi:hypothetical protein